MFSPYHGVLAYLLFEVQSGIVDKHTLTHMHTHTYTLAHTYMYTHIIELKSK